LLQVPQILGVISIGPAGPEKAAQTGTHLKKFLSLDANKEQIGAWWQGRFHYFDSEYKNNTWSKSLGSESSLVLNGDLSHTTRIFPPILLKKISAGNNNEYSAVLPVLVLDGCSGHLDELHGNNKWSQGAVYLLDVAALASEIKTSSWYSIMNDSGQVLISSADCLPAGTHIRDCAGNEKSGLLSVAKGEDVEPLLNSPEGAGHGIFGSFFSPWLVITKPVDNMSVLLMSARPIGYLQNMTMRYFAHVFQGRP